MESRRLVGVPASPGVTVGRAFVVDRRQTAVSRYHVEGDKTDAEVARFRSAVAAARAELEALREHLLGSGGEPSAILEASLLMLEDPQIIEGTERGIREQKMNAEWAVTQSVEHVGEMLGRALNDYVRERRSDVSAVGEKILRHLVGAPTEISKPGELGGAVVLIAHELSPADTAALARIDVTAFVTDVGSTTSHTAIMARALSIPAVVGAAEATRRIVTGDEVVVDGLRGEVIVSPTEGEAAAATDRGEKYMAFARTLRANRSERAVTRCGVPIKLRANIELPGEAAVAIDHGADGIGLYRTEFLYIDRTEPPSEDEQYETFRRIVQTMAPRTITLRTFDLGGDKFSTAFRIPKEMNPALGLRAVRLALREREVFRAQLRAMLRAAVHGDVRVMVPMVVSVSELREAQGELDRARGELIESNTAFRDVPFGVMIETPSAVLMADVLAREADFFSIGTNDLMQYALAIDRGNEHVAHLARTLDPAIVRAVAMTSRAARAAGIPCGLCGAMAGELLSLPVLLGVGVHELSVEPTAVPEVKEALRRIELEDARVTAEAVLSSRTASEAEQIVAERWRPVFEDLLASGELGSFTETGSFVLPEFRGS